MEPMNTIRDLRVEIVKLKARIAELEGSAAPSTQGWNCDGNCAYEHSNESVCAGCIAFEGLTHLPWLHTNPVPHDRP